MIKKLSGKRKYLPLMVTLGVFVLMFSAASLRYPTFFSLQVLFNLLIDNAFVLISAVGMTFVILSGGIDLSVGAVIALVSMVSAWLIEDMRVSPVATIPIVILIGTLLGAGMGALIQYFKIPPFVATLVGMFFARGMCFVISVESITIKNPMYKAMAKYRIGIGNSFLSINVVVAFAVLLIAIYLLHYTPFGRTVYAIGGDEESAKLMGLHVPRSKVLIYTISGLCSGLAGVVYSFYMLSGYGGYANGLELDVIAAVVIGGVPLTGGAGYVLGSLFGVLIQGIIQTIIMFEGTLTSWWTKIAVGLLTLFFIVMQSTLGGTESS